MTRRHRSFHPVPAGQDTCSIDPPDADDHAAMVRLWSALLPPPPPPGEQLLAFMPCENRRPASKMLVVIDDVPNDPPPGEVARMTAFFAEVARCAPSGHGGVLLAVVRAGPPGVTERDVRWIEPLAASCTAHGVDQLGLWLRVGHHEAVRLDAPARAAVA